MDWTYAIVKGIVQGLTEFLPVSSTAHLVLLDALGERFGWQAALAVSPRVQEFYDVMVQLGTLGAIFAYFGKDLWQVFRAMLNPNAVMAHQPQQPMDNPLTTADDAEVAANPRWDYGALGKGLLLSFFTTAVTTLSILKGSELLFAQMGWQSPGVNDISELFFKYHGFVIFHLTLTGLLLWIAESQFRLRQLVFEQKGWPLEPDVIRVTPVQAIRVGLFQTASAIFHGISRSGSTMTAGIVGGWTRQTAARYSFLLGVPTFIAAFVYEVLKIQGHIDSLASLPWGPMLAGTVVAGVVGYGCIWVFIPFLARNSLMGFSIYCWVIAAVLLWIL